MLFGLCVIAALLSVLLKQYKSEYAMAVAIAAGCILFLSIVAGLLSPVFEFYNLFTSLGINNTYFMTAFKALGICLITGFVADICRDFGQTALAGRAELAGRCAVFLLSLPLLTDLLKIAYGWIGKNI